MKIQGIGYTADGKKPASQTIPLQMTGAGTGKAIVPIEFEVEGSPVTTTNLAITGETSRNAKNRRRVMIKVTLDYKALSTDATKSTVVDERRSGGELSCHLVLAGPKAFEDDLRGMNGANNRAAAESQLAIVLRTLVSALGTGYTQPTHQWVRDADITTMLAISREGTPGSATDAVFDPGFEVDRYTVPAGPVIQPNGEYGTCGFRCKVNTPIAAAMRRPINDLGDPIVRGLNGLSPFSATSVINWNGFRLSNFVL